MTFWKGFFITFVIAVVVTIVTIIIVNKEAGTTVGFVMIGVMVVLASLACYLNVVAGKRSDQVAAKMAAGTGSDGAAEVASIIADIAERSFDMLAGSALAAIIVTMGIVVIPFH